MAELLDYNLDDAKPLTTIPDGEEIRVRIVRGEMKTSKKGDPMLAITLEPVETADAQYIYHYIMLPNDKMDDRKRNNALLRLKELRQAFDLPWPLDPEQDLNGQEAWVIVREEEDEEFGKRNSVKKFVEKA